MGGYSVTVRILGLASTSRGFAFAVMEGPGRLVDWGGYRPAASKDEVVKTMAVMMRRTRPLFVAVEVSAESKKRTRGRLFKEAVIEACAVHQVMLLWVTRSELDTESEKAKPAKQDIAIAIAAQFREIAHRLPPPAKRWNGEDDRLGLFLAVAAARAVWRRFASGH